jgi:FtsP/CotA-like multicopper oxidase with cupredoxin domain
MTKPGVWRARAILQYKSGMLRLSSPLILGALAVLFGCTSPSLETRLAREHEGAYPASRPASGPVRSFELSAQETELPLVDGTRMRVWAYNGQVPGPMLRVRLGETLRVHFTNQLPQATTIHWHGVRVPNDMDGVPNATQPPIQPGESFTYEFTPKDAGTYWFHPHVRSSEQVERGLYGVLIVEDEKPLPYTQDVVWVIDDWLLDESRQVFAQFNTRHDLAHDGRWGNAITVNGRTDTELKLRAGERIRLRLLSSSNGRIYAPDFSDLDASIIAVDGLYLREPIRFEGFELAPGNRVDLDIAVREEASRVVPVVDRFRPQRPNQLARIVIDDVGPATPAFPSPAHAHVPAWRDGLTAPITKEFRLNARSGGEYGIEWTLNDEAFAGHDHTHAALTLKRGAFARIRFVNDSHRLHPMHLHGMFFKVLARNHIAVDEPFFRDTVLVHAQETVDIGLVPLDEGDWMMHCHILEHAEAGMMTMIQVKR